MAITVELDEKAIRQIGRDLALTEKELNASLRSAVRRTATKVKREIVNETAIVFDTPKKYARRRIVGKGGYMRISTLPVPLHRRKSTRIPPRGRGQYVTSGGQSYPRAFGWRDIVIQRKGTAPRPLERANIKVRDEVVSIVTQAASNAPEMLEQEFTEQARKRLYKRLGV